MENEQLPDNMAKTIQEQQRELNLQLKVYYENGESEVIPGIFRSPDDVHYGLDQFMDLDVYDMLCEVVAKLKLPAEAQLKIVLAVLNNLDSAARSDCAAVRAEIINRVDGSVVVSANN